MKNPILIALLSFFLFAPTFATANSTGGNIGGESEPAAKKQKVKPGACHTNGDGVEVCNDVDSSGNATVDPRDGDQDSETTVTTRSGFEGSVKGMDGNDTVDVSSNNDITINGDGGTVNMGGGSTATITNTSNPGGASTTINMPSGAVMVIGPGSSVSITT